MPPELAQQQKRHTRPHFIPSKTVCFLAIIVLTNQTVGFILSIVQSIPVERKRKKTTMKTYIAIGTCSGNTRAFDSLESAQQYETANLIVETDNQFYPLKITRAWGLYGNYEFEMSPSWSESNVQDAAYRMAEMIMRPAIDEARKEKAESLAN